MTTTERRVGGWTETYLGNRFYVHDPRPEEIHIEDIAHHLALTNRFGGATRVPYSVAEHSVRVSYAVEIHAQREHRLPGYMARWGLLHDAAEAYLNDIQRPVKHTPAFEAYRSLEKSLLEVIITRFDLEWPEPDLVTDADEILLATEARDLMKPGALDRWTPFRFEPQPNCIEPWDWQTAEARFLARFKELIQ